MWHVSRCLACVCALLALAPGVEAQPRFEGLGHLGGEVSFFFDLSADGSTVVGTSRYEVGNFRGRAFRWRAGSGMVQLDIVSDFVTANGVSADGEVVTGRINSSNARGYVWTEADGTSDIGQTPHHRNLVQPTDISGDGRTIVGYTWTQFGSEAFLHEEGFDMQVIPGLRDSVNNLRVSHDGTRVAGDQGTSSVRNPFVWTRLGRAEDGRLVGTVTHLGDLPGGAVRARPLAISTDGSTVVGESSGAAGDEAFVWSEAHGMRGLGRLRPVSGESSAQGVTGDGAMVVGYSHEGTRFDPDTVELFVWTPGSGMRPLVEIFTEEFGLADELAGWRLTSVAVSEDGLTFAGNGYNPGGAQEAWWVELDRPIPPAEDPDLDQDGVPGSLDNCPETFNPEQQDLDGDGVGDACNDLFDRDGDSWADELDNCPDVANADQTESDGDGVGDACDVCPALPDPEQLDRDGNGTGDPCNDHEDRDGDEHADGLDVCPDAFDPDQGDADGDGLGDVCDPFPFDADHVRGALHRDLGEAEALLQGVEEELGVCLERPFLTDEDGDGEADTTDRCPGTPVGAAVDGAGCSQEQFCNIEGGPDAKAMAKCPFADWRNDQVLEVRPGDCRVERRRKGGWQEATCVAR